VVAPRHYDGRPAATEDAVVALDQRGERGPRRLIESLHGVRRFGRELQPNVGHDTSPFVPNSRRLWGFVRRPGQLSVPPVVFDGGCGGLLPVLSRGTCGD